MTTRKPKTKPQGETPVRSVRIAQEHLDALEKIGERDERSVSWLIQKAVAEFIERHS